MWHPAPLLFVGFSRLSIFFDRRKTGDFLSRLWTSMQLEQQKQLRHTYTTFLSPIAQEQDLVISAIEFITEGRGLNVAIYLDGPQGVSIDQCAQFFSLLWCPFWM